MTGSQSLFGALADPTRRAVLERLTETGPATATSLATKMPISRQAVSKHLAALGRAGLVERTTVGREVRYSARLEPLTEVTAWVDQVGREWDTRLARLRRTLE